MKTIANVVLCLFLVFMCSAVCAENLSDIMDNIDNEVDLRCELDAEAGAALQSMSSDLIGEVNSRISSILDAYNLECLSGLLSIGGIDSPGFNTILNLNFCEIARDQILNGYGGFSPNGFNDVPAYQVDEVKSNILKRARQTEYLVRQLKDGQDG